MIFRAWKDQFEVGLRFDPAGNCIIETWPARAAVKLGLAVKQRQITTGAVILSATFFPVQGACIRALGSFLAQNIIALSA